MKPLTLESFSSRLAELRAKRAALYVDITNKKAECAEIRARMTNEPSAGNAQEVRVRQLLGNGTAKAVVLPDPQRLNELLVALDDLNTAIAILDAQIETETRVASVKLCEAAKPEHSALAKKFAGNIMELHAAHLDYLKFIDAIEDRGASTISLGRVSPHWLGHPRDASGGYHYALKDFVEAGHISKNEIHEAIR